MDQEQPTSAHTIEHWEKIIAAIRGSAAAEVWFRHKTADSDDFGKIVSDDGNQTSARASRSAYRRDDQFL